MVPMPRAPMVSGIRAPVPERTANYVAASVQLTLELAQASGNERLAEIIRSLARQSWRYTQLALGDPECRLESAMNWRALFDAMLQGRAESAGRAMEKLVDDAREVALQRLED